MCVYKRCLLQWVSVFCPDKGRHKTDSLSFQSLLALRTGTLQLISIDAPSVFLIKYVCVLHRDAQFSESYIDISLFIL